MNLDIEKPKKQLLKYFQQQKTISKTDLYHFYINVEKDTSEFGFFWYLYELQQLNVIKSISNDTYVISHINRKIFSPVLDNYLNTINQQIYERFALENYCIWSSSLLNEFMTHQVIRHFTLVEVEKDATEAVFHYLRDIGYQNVFMLVNKADEILLDRYIFEAVQPIIVNKIISKSPVKKVLNLQNNIEIKTPRIEKILVDLFCDNSLFIAYKGSEQHNIFENVLKTYEINFKTMFMYAQRRRREMELKKYLFDNFQTQLNQIL